MSDLMAGTFAGMAGMELELLMATLKDLEGDAVEIGSCDGFSARHILQVSRLRLTAIDPFIPDSMEKSLVGQAERVRRNTEDWKDRFTLIEDYSWNVAPKWTTPLDFLFIDGDHEYASVRRDFDEWAGFVKVGGLLAMHDSRMSRPYGPRYHPGPSQVAKERIYDHPEQWEIVGESHSLTLVRKK